MTDMTTSDTPMTDARSHCADFFAPGMEVVPSPFAQDLERQLSEVRAELARVQGERDLALEMLAEWCVVVEMNGSSWDDWDEHYKDAAYRDGPLRQLLDKALTAARAMKEKK